MKNLRDLIPMIDNVIQILLITRTLSKDEFMSKYNNEKMYKDMHNSKCGLIEITNKDNGKKHYGLTAAFGEGISCHMSNEERWYTTSIINNIDWDKHEFTTLNSTYEFKFKDIDWDKLCEEIRQVIKETEEYERKIQETE